MATNFLQDNGYDQLTRAVQRNRQDAAVQANPVGPPSIAQPPAPPRPKPGMSFDPTGTDLAQAGVLRPPTGPWSASNPQPQMDAGGSLLAPPRPIGAAPSAAAGSLSPSLAPSIPQLPSGPISAAMSAIARPTPGAPIAGLSLQRPTAAGIAAPPTTGAVTSDSGRPLGYGQMVNGVRTFSDGSGDPNARGYVPRTMTDSQISGLDRGNRISVADPGVGGNISADALRLSRPVAGAQPSSLVAPPRPTAGVLASTPELGSADGLSISRPPAMPLINPVAAARAAQIGAQMDAASDAASIANRDPRSVLGSAARNADVEAGSGFGTDEERSANHLRSIASLNGIAASGIDQTGKLNTDAITADTARAAQDAETRRTGITANASIAGDFLRRPQPTTTALADGTSAIVGADGVARPVLDATGKPVQTALSKPNVDQGAYGRMVETLTKANLGDAPADPEQVYKATIAARDAADKVFGQDGRRPPPLPAGASSSTRSSVGPPPEAAEFLRQNPQHAAQFDQKYGKGSAAKLLGRTQ